MFIEISRDVLQCDWRLSLAELEVNISPFLMVSLIGSSISASQCFPSEHYTQLNVEAASPRHWFFYSNCYP